MRPKNKAEKTNNAGCVQLSFGKNGFTPIVKETVAKRGEPIKSPIEACAAIKNSKANVSPTGKAISYILLLLVTLKAKTEKSGSKTAEITKPSVAGTQFCPDICPK